MKSAEARAAIEQTQRVLDAVLAAGWRSGFPPRTVKSADLKLPAQRYAEAPTERLPGFVSYRFPFEEGYDPELAFYSETYVRHNISHVKGDHAIANPEGFYIVAYRDGRVVTVPTKDARRRIIGPHPTIPDATMSKLVFPGMRHYDDPENTPAIPVDDRGGGWPG